MESIAENLLRVEERISGALARSGRKRDEITLIAVTKTFPAEATRAAWEAGLRVFGENYVQEFEQKAPKLRDLADARYHLIGHLQSNKVNKAAPLFHRVQTVDSERLGRRLNDALDAPGAQPMEVMIEVKLSEEESKHGCAPSEIGPLVSTLRELPNLRVAGLMTMPPFFENPEDNRPYFARLRELGAEHGLVELSMGMSNDFEVAIEEGATHIRLGTILFGRRTKAK